MQLSILVVDLVSIQFGQAKQGSTFIFVPSLRHYLSQGASLPSTASVPLSTTFLPLAFPKITGASLPHLSHSAFASWLQTVLVFSLLHTYVLLVLLFISGAAHLPPSQPLQEAGVSDRHVPTSGECFGPEKHYTKSMQVSHGSWWLCKDCLAQPPYTCISFWRWSFRQLWLFLFEKWAFSREQVFKTGK